MMTCELIRDKDGSWWMQHVASDGRERCTLMDAMSEKDAELEAREEGYDPVGVFYA